MAKKFSWSVVAADVLKYSAVPVAVLELVSNLNPGAGTGVVTWLQATVSGLIGVLSAVQSVVGQVKTQNAVTAAVAKATQGQPS